MSIGRRTRAGDTGRWALAVRALLVALLGAAASSAQGEPASGVALQAPWSADEGPRDAAAPVADLARRAVALLDARCTRCHGPRRQKAGLRLDARASLLAGDDPAIVPGASARSALVARVSAADPEERMPPEGAALRPEEIELLRRWIDAGAAWPGGDARAAPLDDAAAHWAWRAPRRPEVPSAGEGWARNPVDRFVAARLEARGWDPAPEADRATLLRRLALDLTGLPPTLAQLDALLADPRADAVDRAADALLHTPAYAEHQTAAWLDLARYADSNGYEKDGPRNVWRYRDWVLGAYARDLPYDRFTVEQLAGDLLPSAGVEQRVATGFHRNTMLNMEGGIDPEEFRVAAVVDRTDTTAAVWLGATLGCARCHDHPHDAFSQRDYFGLYAFFDNTDDSGAALAPVIAAPRPDRARRLKELGARAKELERAFEAFPDEVLAERRAFVERWLELEPRWTTLRPSGTRSDRGSRLAVLDDDTVLAFGHRPYGDIYRLRVELPAGTLRALRLDLLPDPSLPADGPGRGTDGRAALSDVVLQLDPESDAPITLDWGAPLADAFVEHARPPMGALDGSPHTAFEPGGPRGKPHSLVLPLAEPLTLDTARSAELQLVQHAGEHSLVGRVRVALTHDALHEGWEPLQPDREALLRRRAEPGSDWDRALAYWWAREASSTLAPLRARIAALSAEGHVPTTLVLRERDEPRVTRVQRRGDFLDLGEVVAADVPALLTPLPAPLGERPTRLDLARWLVSPGHPLTARVAVNRVWARLFGRGLVATVDDFGVHGEPPTHPELLDWLAWHFRESGWSQRELLRLITSSATYRQASDVPADNWERDPQNLWLARAPRRRVEAEVVRDVALAVSGALHTEFGGPSVFPPQPPDPNARTYSGLGWIASLGEDRRRRSLYTFWRRTAPFPLFTTFDAPSREFVCPRRTPTNTPLQALALLNGEQFVEAAGALAEALDGLDAADDERLALAFRRCTSRAPEAAELAELRALLDAQRALFTRAPHDARRLIDAAREPERPHDPALVELLRAASVPLRDDAPPPPRPALDDAAAAERAAWIVLANALLNLDATYARR